MARKKAEDWGGRPHEVLELMLQGPIVPSEFVCDGCTSSPDLHFVWACIIHDYEGSISRQNWRLLVDRVGDKEIGPYMVFSGFLWYDAEVGAYVKRTVTLKRGFELWFSQFDGMADRIQHNIRILSKYKISQGELTKRSMIDPKRLFGYRLGRWYAKATHDIAKSWAK